LWAGFKNQHTVIYDADSQVVSSPVAIDLATSSTMYFVNNEVTVTARDLVEAKTQVSSTNEAEATSVTSSAEGAIGVGASEDMVFYSGSDGTLQVYDIETKLVYTKATGSNYAGVCYSDNKVYVADNENSLVLQFNADTEVEEGEHLVMMSGPFGLHCVNWGRLLGLSWLGLMLLV
jgi:glucose/arabinose dehydrogenase